MIRTNRKFASGKHALGICDGCGGTFKLHALRDEYIKRKQRYVRKCDDCRDPDHPINFADEKDFNDAEGLQNPRPDTNTGRDATPPQVVFPLPNGHLP